MAVSVSMSLFEAKAGVRATLVAPKIEFGGQLLAFGPSKKAIKEILVHLKTNPSGVLHMHQEPTKLRKCKTLMFKAFDAMLMQKFPVPLTEWAQHVHEPVWFGTKSNTVNISIGHMALTEVRFIVQGSMIVAGLPLDKCSGETIKDKRKNLMMSTIDEIGPLITSHGFCVTLDTTKAIVLPSGFLIMYAPITDSIGLRWT